MTQCSICKSESAGVYRWETSVASGRQRQTQPLCELCAEVIKTQGSTVDFEAVTPE